jgi:hypothetical protein
MIRSTYEEVDISDEYIDVEPVFENPKQILKEHNTKTDTNLNEKKIHKYSSITYSNSKLKTTEYDNLYTFKKKDTILITNNIDNTSNIDNTTNTNNIIKNENNENKKKEYYDYYICPFIGFDGKPCCCELTISTCDGCSRAWMNPITAVTRTIQCFPQVGETDRCAECSCCLCPCGICGDCCILMTFCSL